MRRAFIPTLITLAATVPTMALAGQFQDTKLLDAAVQQFTGHAVGEEGGAMTPVDSRLKLASCALPQFSWLSSTQDAVVVRCMEPAWKIYVSIKRTTPVAAPAAVVKTAVAPPPVKLDPVIKKGDAIMIEATGEGFTITRDGVAMGDAAPGARVLVRVEPKAPPIQAIAVSTGRARLPGWAD